MTSIKVKFRPSTVVGEEGTVFYQIIHERKVRQLSTDYHVKSSEWNDASSLPTCTSKNARKTIILYIRERIRHDLMQLNKIARKLDNDGLSFTVDDVIEEFNLYSKQYSLFNFMTDQILRLRRNHQTATADNYKSALSSFRKFRNGEDIMLDDISSDIMETYEAWLKNHGISPNTISFYMRILRAVYNRAVENNTIENRYPFKRVYTGIEKTVKRALPLECIRKIYSLDLSSDKNLDYARDMFMLSFMLRGMSFIDMAFLRKADLSNATVVYRRRKTGQQLRIQWTKEMQSILDKYPKNSSIYLLPIIKNTAANERCVYRNVGYKINRMLKKIAQLINVNFNLTMYVARHSWASAAKAKGISISIISEGMGHDSEATTQIYLASLDASVVDKANSLILNSLKQ